jgi:hypothetical protein
MYKRLPERFIFAAAMLCCTTDFAEVTPCVNMFAEASHVLPLVCRITVMTLLTVSNRPFCRTRHRQNKSLPDINNSVSQDDSNQTSGMNLKFRLAICSISLDY